MPQGIWAMKDDDGPPHVAMLATPWTGHLIPMAELAKRLATWHGVTATLITFASAASSPTQGSILASFPASISSHQLPPVDLSDLPRGTAVETLMSEECARSLPALTNILGELKRMTGQRLVAFVTDFFGADSLDAARDADGVERRCLFMSESLHALSLVLHLPELVASVPDVPSWFSTFLVPSWAPQIQVLAHKAAGGFLTHCGWNSILEILVHGAPMVAWPLFAEQRMNAVMLSEGAGAATTMLVYAAVEIHHLITMQR